MHFFLQHAQFDFYNLSYNDAELSTVMFERISIRNKNHSQNNRKPSIL